VLSRELGGEMVLLNLESGVYFGLDRVGARAWTLLAQQTSVTDVCAIMLDEYEVAAEVLERDISTLVSELKDKGLLVPLDGETA
jgi:hypothetical protein